MKKEGNVEENSTKLKLLLSVNDDKADKVIPCNKLLVFLAKQD